MSSEASALAHRLNGLLSQALLPELDPSLAERFAAYLSLIVRWNARVNLTSVRDEDAILSRHFVESIVCARALPSRVRTLLDFGSGAGLPGIPIALCCPDIAVTLAESQGKKAAFLQEAVRVLGLSAKVYPERAELLVEPFDCVTLRAVDHMEQALAQATRLVRAGGWLAPMTTVQELPALQSIAGLQFTWAVPVLLPGSDQRILALGQKLNEPASPAPAS